MIESIRNVKEVLTRSREKGLLIYKHSSACPISSQARRELETYLKEKGQVDVYMVIVQDHPEISREIAETLGVRHETPQLLFIRDGKVEQSLNHFSITRERIGKFLDQSLAGA